MIEFEDNFVFTFRKLTKTGEKVDLLYQYTLCLQCTSHKITSAGNTSMEEQKWPKTTSS